MKKSILFIALMMATLFGAQTVQAKTVVLDDLKKDYTAQNGDTLTGKLDGQINRHKVQIAKGAMVVLNNMTIKGYEDWRVVEDVWAGITCLGNATLVLVGNNSVISFGFDYPGIWIQEGYTLTIQGQGTLSAQPNSDVASGVRAAGIGGGYKLKSGNIIINSGTVQAESGYGAGIGSGREGSCGFITINGGKISAKGKYGACIGSGYNGDCGNITIMEGANVTAEINGSINDSQCSIGKGYGGSCGVVKIGGEVYADGVKENPFVYLPLIVWDGNLSSLKEEKQTIIARDGMTIYGTLKVKNKVTIAAGATVTLDNATIKGVHDRKYRWAGLTCLGDATIRLKGTNSIKGFNADYPGIYVPKGSTLTIEEAEGGGSLRVECSVDKYGNGFAAGIGSGLGTGAYGEQIPGGNIVIHGGTITAISSGGGAGIGTGQRNSCGNITIDGGVITAIGKGGGAGIGSTWNASCGNITITDGVTNLMATRERALCSIGDGYSNSTCGTITIGGKVFPDGITEKTFVYPSVCEQPTNVKVVSGIYDLNVFWDASADQDKWTIYYNERGNSHVSQVECTTKKCILSDLQPDTEYVVWVTANCSQYTSASTEKITIKTQPEPCDAPTELTISDVTPNSAVASWKKGCDNQTKWKVELRKTFESEFKTLDIVSSPSYSLTDLEEDTEYEVKITGLCNSREGDPVKKTFTTDVACKPVTDVEVINITQTEATVIWNATNEESEWWVYLYSGVATYRGYRRVNEEMLKLTNLTPGHKYRVRIKAVCDETHSSARTDFYEFETEPAPCEKVQHTTVSEVTENSAKISWDRTGDNQDSYYISYGKWTGTDEHYIFIDDITGTSYTLTGLEPNTEYQVLVGANCGDRTSGNKGVSFTTDEHLCRLPNNFRVLGTSTATEIKLVWEPGRPEEKNFEICWQKESDADFCEPQAVTGQFYTITAEAGTKYDIHIRTVCADGYSKWLEIWHTTPAAAPTCKAPTALARYGNAKYNSFTITWTAGDAADTQWQVAYKAAEDDDYTLLTATEKPFAISGLEPETDYTVLVRTVCGENEYSNWCAERTITTASAPCGQPTTPVVVGTPTYNSATITWTAADSEYQTKWKIYYKASSEADFRTPIEVGETTYTFTDLEPNTSYNVCVTGICGNAESSKSGGTAFTTARKEPDCKKVSDVHVVGEAGSDQVTIGWTAGGDEIEWLVEYGLFAEENYTEITTTENYITLTGLEPQTVYYVRVRALCGELGEGQPAGKSFITAAPANPCVAPTLAVSGADAHSADLTITPGSAETRWLIMWKRTDAEGSYSSLVTSTSYTLSDLDEDAEYEVWAIALCGSGSSDLSDKVTFSTAKDCKAPINVTISEVTSQDAFITWTEGDYDQKNFILNYKESASESWSNLQVSGTHFLLSGLKPETDYDVVVRASCGSTSASSAVVTFTTEEACSVPTNVKINDLTHESATITWDAGATAQYWMVDVVKVSTDELVVPGLAYTNSLAVDGLEPETEYVVRLYAMCDITTRSDFSASVYFTTTAAPVCAMPTNGKASNITARTATITWTAGDSETKWYVIYDNDEGTLGGSELVTATTFELTGLEPKTHYTVNIVAECGPDFYSDWSDNIEFTTEEEIAPCLAPSGIKTVSDPTPTTAELTWTVNQPGQSEWVLEYRSEGETDFHAVNVTALPYTLTGLQEHTRYDVRVKGVCGTEFSEYSSAASFYTVPAPYVCPVPTDVQASKVYNNAALITWTPGDDKQKEWWTEYKTADADMYTHFQTVYEPQITITGLEPETEYSFRVCAYYNGMISEYISTTFTTKPGTPCATPSGVKLAGPASQHQAVVTWTVPEDAPDAWVLDYRSEYEDFFHSLEIETPPYTLDGLEMNTRYDLRLKARCGDSFSDYTRVYSFWTCLPDATCADPTNLQVSDVTASTAFISWTAGEEGQEQWYVLYQRTDGEGNAYGQMVFDTPEITLIGLDGGAEYEVSVTGMCAIESGAVSTTFTTKTPICNAPTDAYLLMIREEGPVIFWTPAARQTSFNVYYKKASEASFTQSITVSDNACTLTGLEYETAYDVQITGLCGSVESDPSNIVSFTMPAEPTGPACLPPTSIEVYNINPTYAFVKWTDEVFNYIEYVLMYKVKGSSDAPQSKHYTQFSAMLSGLESETEYEVSVYTYCDDHLSTEAVSTTFTTPAPLCPNPTNIHVSELTAYTALIEWTPGSLDNLNWNVKYYCTSTPDELIVVDASEGPWYLLTDLTPDTEYGVSVMSLCDGETGPGFTTPITFRTMDNLPTGLEQTIEQTIQVRKVLINGQLFILRDGVQYNIMGIRVSTLGY